MKRNFDSDDDVDGAPPKRRKITPTLLSVPILFPTSSLDSNSNIWSDESDYDDDEDDSVESYYQLHMNPLIILESKSLVWSCL